jgi:hypothetical protein
MRHLQASTGHRSDRRLIIDRLIKIKITDGSTRYLLLPLLRISHWDRGDEVEVLQETINRVDRL